MYSEMNRDNDVEMFWNCIERKMAIIFPQYLRNILKFLGYDSAATVRAITQEDIDEKFEKFAKTKMVQYVPADAKQEDYFYYFRNPQLFYIIPGHKILLKQVVECTRKMTEKFGIDYFNFYRSMEPLDGPTGHAKPIRKRNLATQKSRQYLTATVTTEDQPNPNTERVNLFEKIEVWLEKYKETSTSIKYAHPLSLASIEMVEETDENNIMKIVAMVPCPICGIKKRVTQVFTESNSPYMSLSNYQRHVRSHNGKDKEQEEMKVSSKRRNESDEESELENFRKKRNVYTTAKGNQVLGAAINKGNEYESVLSTKSKNNENIYFTSNESDASQNKQEKEEKRVSSKRCNQSEVTVDVHQNPGTVLTQIPKKQDVLSAVLSNKSENNGNRSASSSDSEAENTQEIRAIQTEVNQIPDKVIAEIPKNQNMRSSVLPTKSDNDDSGSTSSSDSDTSKNRQEIRAVDAYERDQKWKSSRRNSSDGDCSDSEKENLGHKNKAVSSKKGKISQKEKPEPGKKKVYRKRSGMRSNFLITEAEEDNRAETKTKDAKKKSKKPFNRFV